MALEFKHIILAAAAVLSLAACSQDGLVKGAELTTQTQQGNLFVGLKTHLSSNNLQIMSVQLPIYNPDSPLEVLGILKVNSLAPGLTDVDLLVNLTRIARIPSLKVEQGLPNGTFFPVVGGRTENWYSLPLGNSQTSKLYLNLDFKTSKIILGYTLSTDAVSAGIIANLFTGFSSPGVNGYGGIYSGVQPGQSGFAIFADVSSVLTSNPSSHVIFADDTSEVHKKPLQKRIWSLNSRGTMLKFK